MKVTRILLPSFQHEDRILYYTIRKNCTDLYELVLATDVDFFGIEVKKYSYDYVGTLKYSILDCTISGQKVYDDIKILEAYKERHNQIRQNLISWQNQKKQQPQ